MRMNRLRRRVRCVMQRQTILIHRLHRRLHAIDMRSQMRGIVDPALHGEYIDAIRAENDVVDFLQATHVGRDGQRDGQVALLVLAPKGAMRQLLDAVQHLCVKRMRGVCGFGQQWRILRVHQRRPGVLADDAVCVQMVGVLEGFDGVLGVGAGSAVDGKWVPVGVAVAEMIQLLLQIFCFIDRRISWRKVHVMGMKMGGCVIFMD